MKILGLDAFEALDSRGNPTVAAAVITNKGRFCATVPSGASVGAHEAAELRDRESRLNGKGVKKAVQNIKGVFSQRLSGQSLASREELDSLLISCDPKKNKGTLGANAMLAVSIAGSRALAAERGLLLFESFSQSPVLPCPMMNILNGGAHANNSLDIQEFMIMPLGARDFRECMDMGMEVYMRLKSLLSQKGFPTAVGDEGGFAPSLRTDAEALELICGAVVKAGLSPGKDVALALDAAASEWLNGESYVLPKSGRSFSKQELIEYYKKLITEFPVISIEDGMHEDDFSGFAGLKNSLGIQIVGDDLFVTNTERIKRGTKSATAVLIKPNQIGTVSEAVRAITLARGSGMVSIVSHRSGDTEDSFIADLCVGEACGQIKTGAPCRAERTAKYNRLLFIEHELGSKAVFAGKYAVKPSKNLTVPRQSYKI